MGWIYGKCGNTSIAVNECSPHKQIRKNHFKTPQGRFFGGDAQSWLNLQQTYDLKMAEKTFLKAIAKEVKPLAALDTKLALTA